MIVNTERGREEIVSQLRRHGWKGSVYTVDARKISVEALGRYYPNSPMLADRRAHALRAVLRESLHILSRLKRNIRKQQR